MPPSVDDAAPARRARVVAALAGVLLAAPAVLTLDPVGIYHPEHRLGVIAAGAVAGAIVGALVAPVFSAASRRARAAAAALASVVLVGTHSNLIALSFSWAVDPRIVVLALALALATAATARLRGRSRWPATAVLALVPIVWCASLHQALWLRRPFVDCERLASAPGVRFFGTWPHHDDPALEGCVMYDVIADEERGLVFGAYVRQKSGVGAGVLSVRDRAGRQLLRTEPYGRDADRWLLNRLSIDPERGRLWGLMASYEARLPPRIETLRYDAGPDGPILEPLADVPLVLDPSDSQRVGDRILVLDYPRRFDDVSSSRIASLDADDLEQARVAVVDPDGWMTEYMVVDELRRRIFVTDVAGHLFELDLDSLELLRKEWLGISMLSGALDEDRLYVAAPYRRAVVVLDRESLEVLRELPCGDAVRQVRLDRTRRRLYATAYGDGVVCGFDLARDGALLGRVETGTPLRGLFVQEGSGKVLAGGGCGLVEIDPERAFPGLATVE